MVDLAEWQKRVVQNKINHHFNTTDMALEFCLLYEETAEAMEAYRKKLPQFGEELADIAIYLLGIAELNGVNLEQEILRKMEINEKRVYTWENGVTKRID